eukprot:239075_1
MDKPLNRNIRIVVCGDRGVGKTSLIFSFIRSSFEPTVPPQLQKVTVPPLIDTQYYMEIQDTASTPPALHASGHTTELVRKADVVVVVCRPEEKSMDHVVEYWLPELDEIRTSRTTDQPLQIVVAISKIDTITDTESWRSGAYSHINNHPLVEKVVEVSARTMEGVEKTFWMAEFVCRYPLGPLYSPNTDPSEPGELTQRCKRALTRTFRIYDADGDGILSDSEIVKFQNDCFGLDLKKDQLERVKRSLYRLSPTHISADGVTLNGFIALNLQLIEKNRVHTVWNALRKCGHDSALNLRPSEIPLPRQPDPHRLSASASHFLRRTFRQSRRAPDAPGLSEAEVRAVFAVMEEAPFAMEETGGEAGEKITDFGDPSAVSVRVVAAGSQYMTEDDWRARWAALAYFEPRRAVTSLRYLGLDRKRSQLCRVRRDKPTDVVYCLILGFPFDLKNDIMESLVPATSNYSTDTSRTPERCQRAARYFHSSADFSYSGTIILESVELASITEVEISRKLRQCDFVWLCHEPTSANSLHDLETLVGDTGCLRRNGFPSDRIVLVSRKCGVLTEQSTSGPEFLASEHSFLTHFTFDDRPDFTHSVVDGALNSRSLGWSLNFARLRHSRFVWRSVVLTVALSVGYLGYCYWWRPCLRRRAKFKRSEYF